MEPKTIGEETNNVHFSKVKKEAEEQVVRTAAQNAMHGAVGMTKAGAQEIKTFVIENPAGLKTICFVTGLALMVFSIVGMVNIFNIASPIYYIVTIFNVLFGAVITIVEGKSTWSLCGFREKVFNNCGFLAYPAGRAVFYLYVGTMVLGILPDATLWRVLYVVMGSALAICGFLQLCRDRCYDQRNSHQFLDERRDHV